METMKVDPANSNHPYGFTAKCGMFTRFNWFADADACRNAIRAHRADGWLISAITRNFNFGG